jgi:hypothetical protein
MKIFTERLCQLLLFIGLVMSNTNVIAQNNCTCAICGKSCNDIAVSGHVQGRSCYVAPANSSPGSSGVSSPDLKTMVAGAIMQNVLKSIVSANSEKDKKELEAKQRAAAIDAQIAAQRAAEQYRANELRLQAEHDKMMKSFKSLDGTQEMQNKTLDNTGLTFKTLDEPTAVMKEQRKLDVLDTAWINLQKELIKDRKDNKWANGIYNTLSNNAPPLPYKNFDELQPGDVILVAPDDIPGKAILWGDQIASGSTESAASHTITYLKEVNGQKLFMDNVPLHGPTIISEKQLKEKYGSRNMDVAQLSKFGIAQPLNEAEAEKLFKAAVKMQSDNINSGNSNYGVRGDNNMVCSEASWALINSTGRTIPGTDFGVKSKFDVNFSPADFYARKQYFLITSLNMSK